MQMTINIDEIYNLTINNLWVLKNIMEYENKNKIFIATDSLQNEPIEGNIKDKTICNKFIETLFYNHIQLHKSRRIKNIEFIEFMKQLHSSSNQNVKIFCSGELGCTCTICQQFKLSNS